MSYRIVIDSCGDLTPELKKDPNYESVPLELEVHGERIIDDETFDQLSYIKKVAESPTCAKTSCPAPERYLESYQAEVDHVYVVTLSSALSGSYNSAEVARKMYEEQYGPGKVHVFDSKSACCGETLIGRKIEEFEKSGMSFEEVVEEGEKFVKFLGKTGLAAYSPFLDLSYIRANDNIVLLDSYIFTLMSPHIL